MSDLNLSSPFYFPYLVTQTLLLGIWTPLILKGPTLMISQFPVFPPLIEVYRTGRCCCGVTREDKF